METFEQFMILENAIDDVQNKYLKHNPDKTDIINQAFAKYRLLKYYNRFDKTTNHNDITRYSNNLPKFLDMVDSYSDDLIINPDNKVSSKEIINKYKVAENSNYIIFKLIGPNMSLAMTKLIGGNCYWCLSWPNGDYHWKREIEEPDYSIYCFMHKNYELGVTPGLKSGGAITVSNKTGEIQAIYDAYDGKRSLQWLKQFNLPLEQVKAIKLPNNWNEI